MRSFRIQWRVSSGLTVNVGLRYQIQLAVQPGISSYLKADLTALCGVSGLGDGGGAAAPACNMFKPGALTGQPAQYTQFEPGTSAYPDDRNNFAPNLGVAWRPMVKDGFLRKPPGRSRASDDSCRLFAVFQPQHARRLPGCLHCESWSSFSANRNAANNNLVLPGQTWPVLFSDTAGSVRPACSGAITSACYPASPSYPFRQRGQ